MSDNSVILINELGLAKAHAEREVKRMLPVPERFARVMRRRGIEVPLSSSGEHAAALVPYRFRRFHQLYATTNGYFWMPCILCQMEFGGHEIGDTIPDPIRGEGCGQMVCPACTAERNGGTV